MTMAVAAAVAAGLQAVSSIKQGQYQKAMYDLQAKQAELQGRQNALNYSKQALNVLETQRRAASTLVARSAAAGIDPFSGSPMSVDQWNAFQAGEEYNLGLENADMAIAGGLAKSQSLQAAGKQAMQSAYLNAAISVAQGAYSYNKLSTPGTDLGGGSWDMGYSPMEADIYGLPK
jgi:hypothetical protein